MRPIDPSLVALTEELPGVLAQADGPGSVGFGLAAGAVSAFFTTLVLGAILVAVAPGFLERTMARLADDPGGSFVTGLLALLVLVGVIVLLAITIVGIIVVIPLALVAAVVWVVGVTVGYLAIADRLVGREDGWTTPLLVAAGINGALALTGIGGLVSFAVGAAGVGAVINDYRG